MLLSANLTSVCQKEIIFSYCDTRPEVLTEQTAKGKDCHSREIVKLALLFWTAKNVVSSTERRKGTF